MNKKVVPIIITIVVCSGIGGAVLVGTYIKTANTRSTPTEMHLGLPKDTDTINIRGPRLNLLLLKRNRIYYYNRLETGNGKIVSTSELDTILQARKKSADSALFTVVIKPTKDASYKNVVDMLDQMLINNISKYAVVEISDGENELVENIK